MKYHVTPKWDNQNLKSAARRMGECKAIEFFMEKWETEDASWATDQVHKIFLYNSLEEAKNHKDDYGGEILEIDETFLEISIDPDEGYPFVSYDIDKQDIRRI